VPCLKVINASPWFLPVIVEPLGSSQFSNFAGLGSFVVMMVMPRGNSFVVQQRKKFDRKGNES
jgi:hypothetical protein